MPIAIESRRTGKATLLSRYDDPIIVDTTSQGLMPYRKLSPFYPHKNIPVPFSPGQYAASVEGIWQGLKVFSKVDVDVSKFSIDTMKGIKRSTRIFGEILGHRRGVDGSELLNYVAAKRHIYFPSYLWVIEHYLQKEMTALAEIASKSNLILLDYNTASNPLDPMKPISHAVLCKAYLEGVWNSIAYNE
jgi:hypothetical protein